MHECFVRKGRPATKRLRMPAVWPCNNQETIAMASKATIVIAVEAVSAVVVAATV